MLTQRQQAQGTKKLGSDSDELESQCLFCDQLKNTNLSRIRNRIVYEDEYFLASHHMSESEASHYLGLVLIQTKRHVHDLGDLTDAEAERLGRIIQKISRALKAVTGASWSYCYCFLEGVRHVHVLVTSRYPNVPPEYVRLNIGDWPDAPHGGTRDVEELAKRLRSMILG